MIINGYAFTIIQAGIQVVNLDRGTACVLDKKDQVIESSMDDIELDIVNGYYQRNNGTIIEKIMNVESRKVLSFPYSNYYRRRHVYIQYTT